MIYCQYCGSNCKHKVCLNSNRSTYICNTCEPNDSSGSDSDSDIVEMSFIKPPGNGIDSDSDIGYQRQLNDCREDSPTANLSFVDWLQRRSIVTEKYSSNEDIITTLRNHQRPVCAVIDLTMDED